MEIDASKQKFDTDLNVGDMINSFEGVANNPLSKFILSRTFDYCEKDHANRLEVGLELLFNKRDNACMKCRTLSKVLSFIIKKGVTNFGVTNKDLEEVMKDPYWIRGLSSVIKGIGKFGVKKPFVPGAPFQVVWNITHACNLKCAHCYENAGKKDANELSKQEINKGLEILSKAGVTSVAFSGGEPTSNPHITHYIKLANELGMYPALATNGYLLSKEYILNKFVDAGLEFVQISIDGINSETHDSFRGVKGSWDKAIKAVENSVEADLFVEVATTVTTNNINEIPDIIEFVRGLGAHWFMIYNFIPTGNGSNNTEMDISPQNRLNLLKTAYHKNINGDMQVLSTAPQYATVAESLQSASSSVIPTHFYNPKYENPQLMQLAEFVGGCGAGRFYMAIEPNGDLYPCVFFPHDDALLLGNLLEDDFEHVWQNNTLLNNLRSKDLLQERCGSCESKNICGGCRARAYTYFNDVLAPDPGCINNESKWIELKNMVPEFQEYQNGNLLINLESK
jgi:radical SAM protein with 4Fe4S-binding SPASM domain